MFRFFKENYNIINAKKYILLILGFWILSYIINIWPIVFLSILCTLNILLLIYDRYVDVPIDIELSTFSAILMSLKFGLFWGILGGALTKIAAIISNRDFNKNSLVSIFGYILAAFFAHFFSGLNIIILGIFVSLIVNLITGLLFKFVFFLSDYEILLYSITNILFNVVIFMGFAELVFRVI